MPAGLYTMESCNMICGDTGNDAAPGVSTHLEIIDLKLPNIERVYVDHTPGGAPVQVEVPMYVNKLVATFTLASWNRPVMSMILQEGHKRFVAYGLVRERRTNDGLRAMAVFEAQLGRVDPGVFNKNTLQHFEYELHSIVHYELLLQNVIYTGGADSGPVGEIYYWDFFTGELRVGGQPITA